MLRVVGFSWIYQEKPTTHDFNFFRVVGLPWIYQEKPTTLDFPGLRGTVPAETVSPAGVEIFDDFFFGLNPS